MEEAVNCGVCGFLIAGQGFGMRAHVAFQHPENYPRYIDVLTGERVKEVKMETHEHPKPVAKMNKLELVGHFENEHESEVTEATVAELRKLHTAMHRYSDHMADRPQEDPGVVEEPVAPNGAEDDCAVVVDFPKVRGDVPEQAPASVMAPPEKPVNGSIEEPIPAELAQLGITNVGPEGRRGDNILCAQAILFEGKSPEQAHRLKGLSHLSPAAIRYRASRAEVASGLRNCKCRDEDCGFTHANR